MSASKSKELVVVTADEVVLPGIRELDGRQSQETYYALLWRVGSSALALVARDKYEVRAVVVAPDKGNEAMAHPESGSYLGGPNVIYGQDFDEELDDGA